MNKYTIPKMNIRSFSSAIKTAENSTSAAQNYVGALENIPDANKTQVNLLQLNEITKYKF